MTHHADHELAQDTIVVASGRPPREHDAPVNPPIILSSTFHEAVDPTAGDRIYGRMSNPTWDPFEEALGTLEGAALPALVFSSGLGAAAAALSLVPTGGVVVMPRHAYAGSLSLADDEAARGRFTLVRVAVADTEQVLATLEQADLLWLESPTNPMLEVADLRALIAAAKAAGVTVVVDNTFNTPLVCKPLDFGADVVLHSVTKYLAGHSDVVLGALATSDAAVRTDLLKHRTLHGAIAGPFEVWLALRGLRTLALRVERSQANALYLAHKLEQHPALTKVRFPGLATDPGHQRAADQLNGFGSIISIELADVAAAEALVDAVCLWLPATSLGGVESLIERRRRQTGEPVTVPEALVRLSVGIENPEDLWADLEQALDALRPGGDSTR
ncbi:MULTISPECIES: trans-sulfuration enzyme family protein [unclassified Arthrobacter]|uniref:trans-sulfuration enzyme family protein n=1 Tax=unclassified Arthrobacter TaxID=235627 RepID=UPI001492484E|nr:MULTISPECIES: PLP-dependent aspartate aminotransferase family protein [unclassified Arthrobacter]MBE0010828.1 PLP-dependent transferase [Arthrobacter sp. AET 35A]NOJ64605.1 PLP-dependent transferase [Arthrobacter sp. 147(2020)]